MAETLYRRLQREIAAIPECSEHVHTNEMPRVTSARDKDQAIADILNERKVVGLTRRAEASDVQRTLILNGAWRGVHLDLMDLVLAGLSADYLGEAEHLLDPLKPEVADAVRDLCRVPITWELVSRAVRGPWED